MTEIKCPACGETVDVPEKKSKLPWLIGCIVALASIPVVLSVVGLLAAIAIPSFVKARNTSQMNACINNMRYIDSAKEQWAMSSGATDGSPVDVTAANQYIRGNIVPICPAQGTYTYREIGIDPECSVHGSMSAPRSYRRQQGR